MLWKYFSLDIFVLYVGRRLIWSFGTFSNFHFWKFWTKLLTQQFRSANSAKWVKCTTKLLSHAFSFSLSLKFWKGKNVNFHLKLLRELCWFSMKINLKIRSQNFEGKRLKILCYEKALRNWAVFVAQICFTILESLNWILNIWH